MVMKLKDKDYKLKKINSTQITVKMVLTALMKNILIGKFVELKKKKKNS